MKALNAIKYKLARILRGTQTEVAMLLGVTQVTISRRETGRVPVTKEMWLAIMALPERNSKSRVRNN